MHDRFAIDGKTMLLGKLELSTVGHVPREISQYIWYASLHGAVVTVEVKDNEPKNSPLVQGGLEIVTDM